jgi:hypothetical protein
MELYGRIYLLFLVLHCNCHIHRQATIVVIVQSLIIQFFVEQFLLLVLLGVLLGLKGDSESLLDYFDSVAQLLLALEVCILAAEEYMRMWYGYTCR